MGEASSTRLRVSWPWPTRNSSRQIQPWGYKSGKRANATVELEGTLMCFPKSIYTISLIHFWTCCLHNHLWQPFPEGQYWLCKVLPFFKPSTRCNDSPPILDLVNKNSTFILLPLKFWKPFSSAPPAIFSVNWKVSAFCLPSWDSYIIPLIVINHDD